MPAFHSRNAGKRAQNRNQTTLACNASSPGAWPSLASRLGRPWSSSTRTSQPGWNSLGPKHCARHRRWGRRWSRVQGWGTRGWHWGSPYSWNWEDRLGFWIRGGFGWWRGFGFGLGFGFGVGIGLGLWVARLWFGGFWLRWCLGYC